VELCFVLKPVRSEGWREQVANGRSEEIRIAQATDLKLHSALPGNILDSLRFILRWN
jgi:hypothetical protein